MRADLFVKCFRCRVLNEVRYTADNDLVHPHGWATRGVPAAWALGSRPEEILLCRKCTEHVDRMMGAAWCGALDPEPAQVAHGG